MPHNSGPSPSLRASVALQKHGFRFAHSLGQNFITDDGLIQSMLDAAGVGEGDRVLEIGPGAGIMTAHLAARCEKVVAVELDEKLRPVLEEVLSGADNARVVFEDAMRADLPALAADQFGGAPFRVVANLPYYITSDIVERLVTFSWPMTDMNVMVQKEAADRMLSRPGGKTWCALAAKLAYFAVGEVLREVPRSCFIPAPHVDSRFVSLWMRENRPLDPDLEKKLCRVIDCAFFMRRKTLANNLKARFSMTQEAALAALRACGLPDSVRGEALSIDQLSGLTRYLSNATCSLNA